jgi:hypothetical protein
VTVLQETRTAGGSMPFSPFCKGSTAVRRGGI